MCGVFCAHDLITFFGEDRKSLTFPFNKGNISPLKKNMAKYLKDKEQLFYYCYFESSVFIPFNGIEAMLRILESQVIHRHFNFSNRNLPSGFSECSITVTIDFPILFVVTR